MADVVRMVEVGLIREDERLEILDGEIVEMSPKGYRHEGLKGAINRHWGRTCPDGFAARLSTRIHRDPAAGTYASVSDHGAGERLVPALAPGLRVTLADLDLRCRAGTSSQYGRNAPAPGSARAKRSTDRP